MARYDVARLEEFDGVVKKLRRALGVTAFGVNYFDLPPGAEGLEHNETQTNQEEVYVYVKGSGRLRGRSQGRRRITGPISVSRRKRR